MVGDAVAWAEQPEAEKEKPLPPRAWGEQARQGHSGPNARAIGEGGQLRPARRGLPLRVLIPCYPAGLGSSKKGDPIQICGRDARNQFRTPSEEGAWPQGARWGSWDLPG